MVINEENQPPANGKVLKYWEGPDYTLLDTEVKWDGSYPGLDSHLINQWDESSYAGITLRRIILWSEQYSIKLLDDVTLKVHQITEKVGYTDQHYFSMCFKKYYSLTPTEYREVKVAAANKSSS